MTSNRLRFNPAVRRPEGLAQRTALRRLIKAIEVKDKFHHKMEGFFEGILENAEEGVEGYVVALAAPTAAGKSHHLKRFCARELFKPFEDEEGKIRPLISISAPSPCTLRTLGSVIFQELVGIPPKRNLREHEIWNRVSAQLRGQRTSILVIDELHHVLIGRSSEERKKIASTLKGLLVLENAPINIVVAGMPQLTEFIESHPELRRRTRHCVAEPVSGGPKGNDQIAKFIAIVEGKMPEGFTSDILTEDMPERFRKATEGYLGRTAMLIKLAAARAVENGDASLEIKHLADEFEDIFRCGPKMNPFLVHNPGDIRPIRLDTDTSRVTRLRGKMPNELESRHAHFTTATE